MNVQNHPGSRRRRRHRLTALPMCDSGGNTFLRLVLQHYQVTVIALCVLNCSAKMGLFENGGAFVQHVADLNVSASAVLDHLYQLPVMEGGHSDEHEKKYFPQENGMVLATHD